MALAALDRPAAAFFLVSAFLAGVFPVNPAGATIEKSMSRCDRGLCASFRASIAIPDGWVEDEESTRYFNLQFLLPSGVEFEKATAVIYVVVKFNRNKQPLSDFLSEGLADWRNRAKDAKIIRLDDFARGGGKPAFARRQFEAASLNKQGYELEAVTTDGDKDGNEYVVTIVLSAHSRDALKAAEPAYLAILGRY